MEQILDFPSSNPQNSLWQQIMLFCTAFGIAYGIQLLFVILMIEAIGIKEFTAQFIGIIIYGAVNFMVNNRRTFRSIYVKTYGRQLYRKAIRTI